MFKTREQNESLADQPYCLSVAHAKPAQELLYSKILWLITWDV